MIKFALFFFLSFCFSFFLHADANCGKGFIEIIDGQTVLHVKGSPYEMGYQHGYLLKDKIELNIARFIDEKPPAILNMMTDFFTNMPKLVQNIPSRFIVELQGVADGSGVPYEKILLLNLFPELCHCTGLTITGKGTENEELYHVRVLDYSIGKNLQHTAVLMVAEPQGSHAFLNVSYAGFIGSVTGMNEQKISIGEIGGKGYGSWEGIPMAFLLRTILEKTSSLEQIKEFLKSTPRTCEYYYVFADGKTKESLGVYATSDRLDFILPGNAYVICPEGSEKEVLDEFPKLDDCLVITASYKYFPLLGRLTEVYGKITVSDLQSAIIQPVAQESNLHNAIFSPSTLEAWISHAGPEDQPACDQPYHHFNLERLLQSQSVESSTTHLPKPCREKCNESTTEFDCPD